jgi:hypothetical protein
MPTAIHHLKTELYADPKNIFRVHMGLRRKREALTGDAAAKAAGQLRAYLTKHAIPTHAWLLLPDRISLIIQPTTAKSIFTITEDVQKLIKTRALPADAEFFGDFLDHILRKTEDPKLMATELLQGCVIAGLAPSPKEYPYCGTMLYDLNELSNMEFAAV